MLINSQTFCPFNFTFLQQPKTVLSNLIFIDREEDESIRIKGLDLHWDWQVPRIIVPDISLHWIAVTVEGVARVLDDLDQ